jgi:hypothetical protein
LTNPVGPFWVDLEQIHPIALVCTGRGTEPSVQKAASAAGDQDERALANRPRLRRTVVAFARRPEFMSWVATGPGGSPMGKPAA